MCFGLSLLCILVMKYIVRGSNDLLPSINICVLSSSLLTILILFIRVNYGIECLDQKSISTVYPTFERTFILGCGSGAERLTWSYAVCELIPRKSTLK